MLPSLSDSPLHRRTHTQSMESMAATLEAESKAKGDAQRLKKKLEGEVNELEVALDNATRTSQDALKTIKKLQQQIKDMQAMLDDETRAREDLRDQYQLTERRCVMLLSQVEETQTLQEQTDRARKAAENEVADLSDRVSELTANNNTLASQRRKAEQELQTAQAELEDAINEARNNEEKAKKAITDSTRLADELRSEQEHIVHIEKIRELEHEVENEQRRRTDSEKLMRKHERRIKEITFSADEDRKTHDDLRDSVEKLNAKVKQLKRMLEEAEEQANANLAKFKRCQTDLEDAEERVEIAESALNKLRTKNRSSISTTRVTTVYVESDLDSDDEYDFEELGY
ncbi:Myosin heavy chain, striated muscle [Holothuria leucospilota]|uniref:Myosin heavy chain, striated muscle n=1 Tax=Holothuria leucospilota TaxID=206669 RepID=A0A9Q1C284_HOLLE|nr:Myosin heavy chain, striated muscle [Holothuria leucospilota]